MSFSKKLVIAFLILSPFSFSYAQDEAGQIVILSGVNVTDVSVTENNGTITGRFSLQGTLGEQDNISYGVLVRTDKGTVDVARLGTVPVLKLGEIQTFSINYELPEFLKGKADAYIFAETQDGLPVGFQPIYSGTRSGRGNSITCSGFVNLVECTATDKGTTLIASFRTGMLGDEITKLTKLVDSKGKATFAPTGLAPGKYYAVVTNDSVSGKSVVQFSIAGNFGRFVNTFVSQKSPGVLLFAGTVNTSLKAKVEVVLSDSKGKACGSGSFPVQGITATGEVNSTCSTGILTANLTDENGNVLDTTNSSFDILPFNPNVPKASNSSYMYIAISLLVLLLLGYFAYRIIMRNTSHPTPTPATPTPPISQMNVSALIVSLVLISAFISGTGNAKAIGWSMATFKDYEVCDDFFGTLDPNKSTYTPGEAMTISSHYYIMADAHCVGYANNAKLGIQYQANPFDSGAFYSAASGGQFHYSSAYPVCTYYDPTNTTTAPECTFESYGSGSFTAPNTATSHTLWLRPWGESFPIPNGPGNNYQAKTFAQISFNVTNPIPPPVIRLWFGGQ